MTENTGESLEKRAYKATLIFTAVLAILIFVGAGSLFYWQGWLFLATFLGCCVWTTQYFLVNNPTLVEQRMNVGPKAEREPAQKRIQTYNSVMIMLLFIGSVLDYRFRLSTVPAPMVILGNILIILSFIGFFFVFRQNSFATATVEIQKDQRVISTGLYGLVRHPMYASALPFIAGIPLALASYWGLIGFVPMLGGLVARLLDEEKHLIAGLAGYDAYRHKVRYRLVPGIW